MNCHNCAETVARLEAERDQLREELDRERKAHERAEASTRQQAEEAKARGRAARDRLREGLTAICDAVAGCEICGPVSKRIALLAALNAADAALAPDAAKKE